MKKYYKTKCAYCGNEFERKNCHSIKHQKKQAAKRGYNRSSLEFCDNVCFGKYRTTSKEVKCGWCDKTIVKMLGELNSSKSGKVFCSISCSASYNNTQRRKSRRSKCEILLFNLLKEKYSQLKIISNDKQLLNGLELDIVFPELSLAIEWNGIIHFKPIFGEEKLNKIKSLDMKKRIVALEKGIRLVVISDFISNEKYVRDVFCDVCEVVDGLLNVFGPFV